MLATTTRVSLRALSRGPVVKATACNFSALRDTLKSKVSRNQSLPIQGLNTYLGCLCRGHAPKASKLKQNRGTVISPL
jgi:hypothetical protein